MLVIKIIRLLRFERVYLPLYKVADTPFDLRRQIIIVPLDFDFLFFCFFSYEGQVKPGQGERVDHPL